VLVVKAWGQEEVLVAAVATEMLKREVEMVEVLETLEMLKREVEMVEVLETCFPGGEEAVWQRAKILQVLIVVVLQDFVVRKGKWEWALKPALAHHRSRHPKEESGTWQTAKRPQRLREARF
jgi:hypothetical protein